MPATAVPQITPEAHVEWRAVASHERREIGARHRQWAGRIASGIACLFLFFDGIVHLTLIAPVLDSSEALGFPMNVSRSLGIIELACLAFYLAPRTAVLGAILLTGYLGGAIAAQLRIAAPLFSTTLLPLYVAILLWGGLWLRDEQLREVLPVSR